MTKQRRQRPAVYVDAVDGAIYDVETGEVIVDRKRTRLVRAFARSVERCVAHGAPHTRFRLMANKDGQICTAIGPIIIQSAEMAFPGAESAEYIARGDAALNAAGCTRGNTPSGRALDYAIRTDETLSQWRAKKPLMQIFNSALYGGIQIGGDKKPLPKDGRINMDIVSCYPHLATQPLPRVRDMVIENGYKHNAALLCIAGTQSAAALFQRMPNGNTYYGEDVIGWYAKEEVEYHEACGRLKVQSVLKSCTFNHEQKYLTPIVEHLFTHREKYPRGTPERNVIKSALNGLLGKFAAPISTWRTPTEEELTTAERTRKFTTVRLGASALVNDLSLSGIYPRHSNIIWTAVTYARARVKLWRAMDHIAREGGKVLWSHTDAIIADVPASFQMTFGEALGDWRLIIPN